MIFDDQLGFLSEGDVIRDNTELRAVVQDLQESFDDAAQSILRMRAEDEGWQIIGQVNKDDGFSRKVIQDVARKSEIQSTGNPLLKRAFELRFNPIFARGFRVESGGSDELKPRFQRKLDNSTVKELLFSAQGYEDLERTCYNVGNLFIAYNTTTGDVMRIDLSEIQGRAVDPDMPSRTAYYKWGHSRTEFNGDVTNVQEWLPVVEWKKSGKDTVDEIAHAPVNHELVVIDMRVNVPTSGHWGIPDVFPALPYAWAYSEYIRDASSLLKALNTIAWRLVGKSKAQTQAAGVALAAARKAGSTAAMTAGAELTAMPKAGQVDMADGMALAAMVASATGVSTTSLISISQGGTAAAVASLDGPTVAMARARQERWVNFYDRLFMAMGFDDDIHINFPKITEDPIYRVVASLATGRATGAIFADEYRAAFIEAMSINPTHPDAPPVEEYAAVANALGFIQMMKDQVAAQDAGASGNDPLARQGNSGVAGKLGSTDNAGLRKQDNKAASGTQTDLTG